tara:strand:+ start:6173 stop:6895 length:723 start_codon:yes stop_codon:yes gene_type:complete
MAQKYFNIPNYSTLLTDFIALMYPEVCIGCGEALLRHDGMICMECNLDMPVTHFEKHADNPVERLFWFKAAIEEAAAGYFFTKKSRIQNMIHAFKYKGNVQAALFLGERLGHMVKDSGRFKTIDLIVPVPLHPNKLQKRGYNQAEQIALGMTPVLNRPVNTTAIVRSKHNPTQTKKGLFSRWTNVKTIFELANPEELKGKHVLLVDDVITSGSTIEACARQILQVPDAKVSIISLAIATG